MRGLKPDYLLIMSHRKSRIFYRCVDWNWIDKNNRMQAFSRIFYRCVDWNWIRCKKWPPSLCRIFYRCVDWNPWRHCEKTPALCRIFYRCVDWNKKTGSSTDTSIKSHLLQMRGLKLHLVLYQIQAVGVASFTDAWIETPLDNISATDMLVASFTDAWIETKEVWGL